MEQAHLRYEELLSEYQIQQGVCDMADILVKRFKGRLPPMVALMNGARPFARDLGTAFTGKRIPFRIYELRAGRYDKDNNPTDTVWVDREQLAKIPIDRAPLVLKLDDVLDEGGTDVEIARVLTEEKGVMETGLVTVVNKQWMPRKPRPHAVEAMYSIFNVPREYWLVGYGMDDAGEYRDLPWIGRKR